MPDQMACSHWPSPQWAPGTHGRLTLHHCTGVSKRISPDTRFSGAIGREPNTQTATCVQPPGTATGKPLEGGVVPVSPRGVIFRATPLLITN